MHKKEGKISLVRVNELNAFLGSHLQSTPKQIEKKLITSVPESIVEVLKNLVAEAFFICLNDTAIGYTAVVFDKKIPEPDKQTWLWQFMIDKYYQGNGYASVSLPLIIDYIFNNKKEEIITLSTKPNNSSAIQLYKKFGFIETGEKNDDEIIFQKHKNVTNN